MNIRLCQSMSLLLFFALPLSAQFASTDKGAPKDSPFHKEDMADRPRLEETYVNERDVLWEKRIWREITIQEKKNEHFRYEKEPFINILLSGLDCGQLDMYADESFEVPLEYDEILRTITRIDTVAVFDPDCMCDTFKVVHNDFDWRDIKRYRIKESWFVDTKYSKLGVRILGIAPIREVRDENGNLIAEMALGWIYYPHARDLLNSHKTFNPGNDNSAMSWDDIFQMRYFGSNIIKESNVHDRRIKDYKQGRDALHEGVDIHEAIRAYEEDLWEP